MEKESSTSIASIFASYKGKSWREILIGNYDYKHLCTPSLVEKGDRSKAQFFTKDEAIPILLALLMGFQHAVSVVGGIVLLVSLGTYGAPPATQQYLISCAFIVSGIISVLQVCAIPIPFTKGKAQIGTGLLSLVGTSSAFVSLFMTQVGGQLRMNPEISWVQAYGGVVGALTVSSLVGIFLAMLPPSVIRRVFPAVISGMTVMLIGTSLADSALQYWGGGIFCSRYVPVPTGCQVLDPSTGEYVPSSNCYMAPGTYPCSGNGDVKLPFGSPEYIGFGFTSLVIILLIEAVGSPFSRSSEGLIALLGAFAFVACFNKDGASYVSTDQIKAAPWFTFLWVEPIPLSFYLPAFLPGLILSVVDLLDTIGDVTATSEASRVVPQGEEHEKRIRGAILADVVASVVSGLAGGMPVTTYSQNNSVIAMSSCASRVAGLCCCGWIVIFGMVAKIGAFFAVIPNCVLGGISVYLVGQIIVSGINILSLEPATRRNRVILSTSLALGIGVEMVPQLFGILWTPPPGTSSIVVGLKNGVIGILQNGVSLGALTGLLLNGVMPMSSIEEIQQAMSFGDHLRTLAGGALPITNNHAADLDHERTAA